MDKLFFFALAALCLTPYASPPLTPYASPLLALAVGMIFALTLGNPFPDRSHRTAALLLKVCVVLLGFGMNLTVVLRAGADGAALGAGSIALTLLLGAWLGKRLAMASKTTALVSAGTAICGGSAIAAVGAVIGAGAAEMAASLGTVFLLNAVALYTYPIIGHALHLSQTQFGTWAGIGIHDISSVVGAASHYGQSALETATAVKLARALWIMPVSLGAARLRGSKEARAKVAVPGFIGFFLLASAARTFVPGVAAFAPGLSHLAAAGLTLTLFLIGTGLSRTALRAIGVRPLALGVTLWLVISVGSLAVVMMTVR